MRTMFVAQDNGTRGRRKFQKPNILRRRPKPSTKQNISISCESPGVQPLVTSTIGQESKSQLNELTEEPSGTVVSSYLIVHCKKRKLHVMEHSAVAICLCLVLG